MYSIVETHQTVSDLFISVYVKRNSIKKQKTKKLHQVALASERPEF